jgi:hypothetical protein
MIERAEEARPRSEIVWVALYSGPVLLLMLRGHRTHYLVATANGEWDTLICRVPVSAKPIMAKAPISMQIVINRPLGSLILGERRARRLVERRAPCNKGESGPFQPIARAATSDARQRPPGALFRAGG